MPLPNELTRVLPDEAATEALGQALAAGLPRDGEGPLVAFLEGPLGAGKTTLVRALLRALGVAGTVRSPSYTLLEAYDAPPFDVRHLDLYRLSDPSELEALGVRDELHPGRLLLVEWPGKGAGHLPTPDLTLVLGMAGEDGPEARSAHLRAGSPVGRRWLATLAPAQDELKTCLE